MLSEVNLACDRLGLPVSQPIKANDVTIVRVFDYNLTGFMGSIELHDYSFDFSERGKLRYITRLTERDGISFYDYQRTLSTTNVTMTRSDAYRSATNLLRKMEVDVTHLEKDHPVGVQFRLMSRPGESVQVPLFWVDWGTPPYETVEVLLSAVSGDLLWLRENDDSYSGRPAGLVTNVNQLLGIADSTFLKYSPEQQRSLVSKYAAVHYGELRSNAVVSTVFASNSVTAHKGKN